MGQRVNIQYSVNLEDLPREIDRIATRSFGLLKELSEANKEVPENILSLDAHTQFDQLRLGIADLDVSLGELNELIGSYLSYRTEQITKDPAAMAPVPPNADPASMPAVDNMAELQAKMESFRRSMESPEAPVEIAD